MMKRACLMVLLAVSGRYPAVAEDFATQLFSAGYVTEKDESGERLEGVKVGWLVYMDDHAPPMTGGLTLERLEGDSGDLSRLGGTFSIIAFPLGRASIWIRPVLGLERRNLGADDELNGFGSAGAELIFRPSRATQLAATYDWIASFSGESTSQVGLAFRLGLN